jgi:hypothetical protein
MYARAAQPFDIGEQIREVLAGTNRREGAGDADHNRTPALQQVGQGVLPHNAIDQTTELGLRDAVTG